MTNQIAKILFLPEVFFETVEGRKGIAGLRLAQEAQIIDLIKYNLTQPAFIDELRNKDVKSQDDVVTLIWDKLDNLEPLPIIDAPAEA